MKSKHHVLQVLAILGLVCMLAGAPLFPQPAQASYEDSAIFYDELSSYGSWVEYEQFGPVWYPNQVEEDWRPYADGRWVPSEQGYLFETNEPWGWATYHYGNWMPTENYGWVWVPGRTWYPNTVTWRTSPDDVAPDASYIGWAPIPPPNYVPPPAYAPPPSYGGGYYPGGYYPGGSVLDLIAAPLWIFSRAASFLLGFGYPYSPGYSYYNCGCLAPPTYIPVIYPVTSIIGSWYYPSYYRPAFFGTGLAVGAYSWGPPVRYVSRVTNINNITINNYIKKVHVNNVRGNWPGNAVFKRNPNLRKIVPSENPAKWTRPMRVRNERAALANLGNPRAIAKPAGLRPLDRGKIPRAAARPARADRPMKMRGLNVPRRAQQRITPGMANQIKKARLRPGKERVPGVDTRKGLARPEELRGPGRARPERGAAGFQRPGRATKGLDTQRPGAGRRAVSPEGVKRPAAGRRAVSPEGVQKPGKGRRAVRQEDFQAPGRSRRPTRSATTQQPSRTRGPQVQGQSRRTGRPQGYQGAKTRKSTRPEGFQPARSRRATSPARVQTPGKSQRYAPRPSGSQGVSRRPTTRPSQAYRAAPSFQRSRPSRTPQVSRGRASSPRPQTVRRAPAKPTSRPAQARRSSKKPAKKVEEAQKQKSKGRHN